MLAQLYAAVIIKLMVAQMINKLSTIYGKSPLIPAYRTQRSLHLFLIVSQIIPFQMMLCGFIKVLFIIIPSASYSSKRAPFLVCSG
jgi:hypothetical protein